MKEELSIRLDSSDQPNLFTFQQELATLKIYLIIGRLYSNWYYKEQKAKITNLYSTIIVHEK